MTNDTANEIRHIVLTRWHCYLICWYSPHINTAWFPPTDASNPDSYVIYGSGACLFPLRFSCFKQKWALKTPSAHCFLFLSGIMYCPLCLALAVWNENNPNVKGFSPSPVFSISARSLTLAGRKITAPFILHKLSDTCSIKRWWIWHLESIWQFESVRCIFKISGSSMNL